MKNLKLALKTIKLFIPLALLAMSPLWLCVIYFKNKTFFTVTDTTYGGIIALVLLITLLIVVIHKVKKRKFGVSRSE